MCPGKSKGIPQIVTLQVACEKPSEEKRGPHMTNVTELALVILGIGCGLTLSATGIALYVRGELGSGLPKAFSGLKNTLPMSDFLFGGSFGPSQQESMFMDDSKDLQSQEPLLVALASPSNSIATVVRHGLSGSKTTRKKGLLSWGAAYEQAAPPEQLPKPQDVALPVTTISPSVASEYPAVQGLAALAPPPALAAVQELQSWFDKGQPSLGLSLGGLRESYLFKQAFMIVLVVVAFSGLLLGLNAVVRNGKSSTATFDVEADNASDKLTLAPGVLTDNDIMEAFDVLDRNRMGFIDRATVNNMLGHMALPGHLDAAAPFLGSVKKLFYEDFRRLAQQPGPFADVVMERVKWRAKRMVSDSERAAAFDERCKLGVDVDITRAARWISQSPLSQQPYSSTASLSAPGRRSWAEMRADLAPKSSSD